MKHLYWHMRILLTELVLARSSEDKKVLIDILRCIQKDPDERLKAQIGKYHTVLLGDL
jgi:hypothetical protein